MAENEKPCGNALFRQHLILTYLFKKKNGIEQQDLIFVRCIYLTLFIV